ncbi:uncharacterized [Tachysurus ichikawai]
MQCFNGLQCIFLNGQGDSSQEERSKVTSMAVKGALCGHNWYVEFVEKKNKTVEQMGVLQNGVAVIRADLVPRSALLMGSHREGDVTAGAGCI